MGEEKYKSHLNTLKEMILDEEKLVTYISISKEFCIHVNESKSLLNEAIEDFRKKQPNMKLNVNYIISGLAEDNKARTFVCSENDLSECKKGLKLLFYNHIYSINKGNPSVDKVAFMAVTTFDDYQLCSGIVKNNDCIKRASDEIDKLKLNSQVQVNQNDQKVTKPPAKKVKEEIVKNSNMNGHGDAKKVPEMKSELTIKQEKTSPTKENVNGKQKPEVKNVNKSQKGIAGFFSRSDSAPVKKTTKECTINKTDKIKLEKDNVKVKEEEMDVDEGFDVKKPTETKVEISEKTVISSDKNKKVNNTNNKVKDNNKSLTQIKKNAKVDKKRKRVLHVSDSESEEDKNDPFVDEEEDLDKRIDIDSEDEIPPTPAINTIKVASNMLNPRKRRKIVNKTYTDEEGYILTRKEEVYESLSESEDITETKENIQEQKKSNDKSPKPKMGSTTMEVSPTKKNGLKNKKKISPPQKGKQATLMSFFKKA